MKNAFDKQRPSLTLLLFYSLTLYRLLRLEPGFLCLPFYQQKLQLKVKETEIRQVPFFRRQDRSEVL